MRQLWLQLNFTERLCDRGGIDLERELGDILTSLSDWTDCCSALHAQEFECV